MLTGSYVYSDAESDAQNLSGTGSAYRFVRSTDNNAASTGDNVNAASGTTGGSNKTYNLQAADVGKYLFYCVTPKASAGTLVGSEVCSSATAAVADLPVDTGPWPQSIYFLGSYPGFLVGTTGSVSANATSGLPVTLASMTLGICTVTGNTLTALAAGTCSVSANQAGNGDYYAAPQAMLNIAIGKGNQTIGFGAVPSLAVGGSAPLGASASSGLPVSYGSSTPSVCTVSGSMLTGVTAGTCSVAADQPGNAHYNAAATVTQNIVVGKAGSTTSLSVNPLSPGLAGQTMTLSVQVSGPAGTPGGSVVFVDGGIPLGTATLNGRGAASYAGNLGVGTHSLSASYAGDAAYLPSLGNLSYRVANTLDTLVVVRTQPNLSQPGESVPVLVSITPVRDVGTVSGTVEVSSDGQSCSIVLPAASAPWSSPVTASKR